MWWLKKVGFWFPGFSVRQFFFQKGKKAAGFFEK